MTCLTIFWEKAFAFLLFACLFVSSQPPVVEFNYDQASPIGPLSWGSLSPEWTICGTGKSQSPIDIPIGSVQSSPTLGDLQPTYAPSPAIMIMAARHINVIWKGDSGKININGSDYKVVTCHWHSPSEHTFGGIKKDLEIHLIHQNEQNQRAVIGMAFQIGEPDPFLAKLLPSIKTMVEGPPKDLGILDPMEIGFDVKHYYRYIGSLTSPPCTEGVIWTVLKEVKTVSAEQIQALKDSVIKEFKENARPVQALEGRSVLFYDADSNPLPSSPSLSSSLPLPLPQPLPLPEPLTQPLPLAQPLPMTQPMPLPQTTSAEL